MNYTDFRIKFYNFFRKNKNKIFIGIIVLTIIIVVNILLGKKQEAEPPSTNYEPHMPIISGSEVKSKSTKNKIEEIINNYLDYCNQKNYEKAYNSLTEACREYRFENDIETFKEYIDYIFDGEKIYSIQSYSNKDNIYIYQVTISEDILATGMNTESSDTTYKEKLAIIKDGDNYGLSVGEFIKQEDMEIVSEDDYMKIKVLEKISYYDELTFTIEIKNKTDYDIVLEKDGESDCIAISLGGDIREQERALYGNTEKIIYHGTTKKIQVTFPKYFDEEKEISSIIFDKVRVLEKYTGDEDNWEEELSKAIKQYSATINFKEE